MEKTMEQKLASKERYLDKEVRAKELNSAMMKAFMFQL